MSWNETCIMEERMRFVVACLEGLESVSELCRCFGISRKTGHKWLERFRAEGVVGLEDRSRAPHGNPRAISAADVDAILAVRRRYDRWGPRKVKAWLESHEPDIPWPAASTIGNLFDRAGLTRPRKRRVRTPPSTVPFSTCREANDIWCIDFKGWFLTGDGTQVDPLTLSDAHSRYLLSCEVVGRTDEAHVWPILERAFYEYGLPKALRSDNGAPFASRALGGLSRLAVKLIKTGVLPERIAPGKPQQNGRHERLHLTLKQETASPPARTLKAQMARFDEFRQIYNHERPHEALGQVPPAKRYRSSHRTYTGTLRSPEPPDGALIRKVRSDGTIKWKGELLFLSQVLYGEPVALLEVESDIYAIKYGPINLALLKGKRGVCQPGWRINPATGNKTGNL